MFRRTGPVKNTFSYDPKCEDLAIRFLLDFPCSTPEDKWELAQAIQTAIEDYLMKFDDLGGTQPRHPLPPS